MTSDPLERSVISYIHGQFVMMNEKSNVADAIKVMNKKNAETIIVTNNEGKLSGIITDSDILDKVVMTGKRFGSDFHKSYYVISCYNYLSQSDRKGRIRTNEGQYN